MGSSLKGPTWWPPVLFSLALVGTTPFLRPVSNALRDRGVLTITLAACTLILAVALIRTWRRDHPGYSPALRWPAAGCLAVFAAAMMGTVQAPEERVHFLSMGLLTYLFYRPLALRHGATGVFWKAALLAALVGALEESLQRFIPARVFDWRDIAINTLAAACAGGLLRQLRAPMPRPSAASAGSGKIPG